MSIQDAVSGAQREPDERVRELQRRLDDLLGPGWRDDEGHMSDEAQAWARDAIATLRRLQAAQREPVAWIDRDDLAALQVQQDNLDSDQLFYPPVSRWKTAPGDVPLYTQAQRDDHPTEGLPDWLGWEVIAERMRTNGADPYNCTLSDVLLAVRKLARAAASKGTPDSMGQGGLKDSGVSSQCHSSGADQKPKPRKVCGRCGYDFVGCFCMDGPVWSIKRAAEAHTNLNLWGVIVAILEGGTLYGGRGNDAKRRIIQICHAEIQKELRIFDSECTKDIRSQAKEKP